MADTLKIVSTHFSETQRLTPDNRLEELVVINYTLSDGSTGSIKVPTQDFEPENIKRLLEVERAKRQAINDAMD